VTRPTDSGLEFMGKDWDRPWEAGAGMTKTGLGDRNIPWPSFGSLTPFGSANPSCATCGGRLRGKKQCSCETPDWRVKGEKVGGDGPSMAVQQAQAMQAWHRTWLLRAYDVLTPGGRIQVFGGSRVFHRLAAAMEDSGFDDIRLDAWAYGSGFPKSHNVAVYLDRMLTEGKSRAVIRKGVGNLNGKFAEAGKDFVSQSKAHTVTTPEALAWLGWGTAMKPAFEPVIIGRKPLAGSPEVPSRVEGG